MASPDMKLHQLCFLLTGEGVQRARFEVGEGAIRRGENCEAVFESISCEMRLSATLLLCSSLIEHGKLSNLLEDGNHTGWPSRRTASCHSSPGA